MMQKAMMKKYTPPETPGDEIVISGIAGRFPESRNMQELSENLMNKVDLITSNQERWDMDHPEIPKEGGKIHDLSKFDTVFFGVHSKLATCMDPMSRLLLEHAYEAITDSGINPKELRGSKTAVIVGACVSEAEKIWFYEKLQANGFGIMGCSRAMLANRVSFALGLHGPSYTIDTACSSSLTALDHAYRLLRSGQCDQAIVGGSNLCLHPYVTLQFGRLGLLAPDCRCKSFDIGANGYVRSEAVSVVFLQRARDAKRIYATVCYTKTNCDGYKEQGITFPGSGIQLQLFNEFYSECNIPRNCLSYVEAHATGTRVGDIEELSAIKKAFVQNRKEPLLIGSVKSNLGHSEPASGMCSLAKVIIAMETGVIPPNLHYKEPNQSIKELGNKIKVISEPTPWEGGYAAVNSFGFGGANAHVLLKSFTKDKIRNGAPSDSLPRLVVVSGRTDEAVSALLESVENKPVDVEYVRLLHNIYKDSIPNHLYRGYALVGGSMSEKSIREVTEFSDAKRPLWFVFSGMGSQWAGMGEMLMQFSIFEKAIQKCDAVLKPYGVDIVNIITNKDKTTFDNILNSFVGIAAIQIGLVDLLTAAGIVPDNIIGHSVGELGCAYADGCFTAEQMVLSAYSRGLASIETKMIRGSMAAVGLGYEDVKGLCPPDIEVACHNGPESSTISGPAESMKEFVGKLQEKKIFAKEIPCSNIAYHSRYIAAAGPKLLAYLKKVIPDPKPRSAKWLSTSVPRKDWSSPAAQLCSAEYHTNNLLNSVLFEETARLIPANAITIEIAPHGLLQAILRRSLKPGVTNIALTQRGHNDNAAVFLQALGKLYNVGLQPELHNLYPVVEFPVSRGTPMISPHIKWEHTEDFFVPSYKQKEKLTTGERTVSVELKDENCSYMRHHVIDGRNLIPATGYLLLVWETFAMMSGRMYDQVSVVFENIRFERATSITPESTINLTIMIQKGTGRFEIIENTASIVTGMIRETQNIFTEKILPEIMEENNEEELLSKDDIYKEFKLRGYEYTGPFRGISSASINGTKGHIEWHKNWAAFMDLMLQFDLLSIDTRALYVPTRILKICIDTKLHNYLVRNLSEDKNEIPIYMHKSHALLSSGGIEIRGLKPTAIFRRKDMNLPILEEYKFVGNRDKAQISLTDMLTVSVHFTLENTKSANPNILELVTADDTVTTENLMCDKIIEIMSKLPMVDSTMTVAMDSNRCDTEMLPPNAKMIQPEKLPEDGTISIAIGYDLFSKKKHDVLDQLLLALNTTSFILTSESIVNNDVLSYIETYGFKIVLEKQNNGKTLLFLKRQEKSPTNRKVVHVRSNSFSWLEELQSFMNVEMDKKHIDNTRLILVSENDPESGILGFAKCLIPEQNGQIVRVVMIEDKKAPKFSLDNPFYVKQLEIDAVFNILRPGNVWGTYRHIPLPPQEMKLVPHSYLTQTVRGDLGSLQWKAGNIDPNCNRENLVFVTHASLNFRDVMLATGKLAVEVIVTDKREQDCYIGFEYSGITPSGRRVMGFRSSKCISNVIEAVPELMWDIPEKWSLEDAATVPVAYITSYIALFTNGKMKKGDKVLIHAGSGAVGQAAINLALNEGCEVFTTVGTVEKRIFIKKTFPSIDDDHIGNSRDTSFEQLVMKVTKGYGVDIVLNSLAEEKLQASVRCLAKRGRFLEIGKFDLSNNSQLGLEIFLKEASFHGIMLDNVIARDRDITELHKEMTIAIKKKAFKPMERTCFARDAVQSAFKYMAAGKHIGKVIIKIHEDNEPVNKPIPAYPYFNSAPNKSYVLIGGLGGFGLELADWLVMRGAKNIVLVSRSGVKNGYQRRRIETWKSYDVNVLTLSNVDSSKTEDCEYILKSAEKLAPVDGIFNLAVNLRDAAFINQTAKSFEESLKPKMGITKKLDEVSRKYCSQLRHFVVFSSVSCGRGNPGQTNYGMGNAIMEKICEKRVQDGLPGLAIEWGPIGEVGILADVNVNIGGILQQNIFSCLETLNHFLMQKQPIVSSIVVAEKSGTASKATNILEAIMNIICLKDLKSVSHSASLAEMGMDSMMATEIKQVLERDFGVFITNQDIRNLNIGKILEMSNAQNEKAESQKATETFINMKLPQKVDSQELKTLMCIELPVQSTEVKEEIFLIPGIEGFATIFSSLSKKLKCPATCLQPKQRVQFVEDTSDDMIPYILERNKNRKDFIIAGYSYGALIAIEIARKLEAKGISVRLILIDGSPDLMKSLRKQQYADLSDNDIQNTILTEGIGNLITPVPTEFAAKLSEASNWEEKLEVLIAHIPTDVQEIYSSDVVKMVYTAIYQRVKNIALYDCYASAPIKAPITLLKPTLISIRGCAQDYGLRRVTDGKIDVQTIEGSHQTMIDNEEIAKVINGIIFENQKFNKGSLHEDMKVINIHESSDYTKTI